MNKETKQSQRRIIMNRERLILLKLTDILEKEKMINLEERNYAFSFLKTEGKL